MISRLTIALATFGFLANAGPGICKDRPTDTRSLTIAADKDLYVPGDHVRIATSIGSTSQIDAQTVDAAVLQVDASGRRVPIAVIPGRKLTDLTAATVSVQVTADDIGVLSWLYVLCHPGQDPSKIENWLAVAGTTVFVLPQDAAVAAMPQASLYAEPPQAPVLIAHGGGEYRGRIVTNCLEAFDFNYSAGHRYFEVDLNWTSDGHLVLVHDWQGTYRNLFIDADGIPSLPEFESGRMRAGTTQMTLDSLLQWLRRHPSAAIVTDVKTRNLDALAHIARTADRLKRRIIPQIYAPSEFGPARSLGFEKIILTLYRSDMSESQILNFIKVHAVYGLTLSVWKAFSLENLRSLAAGTRIYVHTINHPRVLFYLRRLGASGVYTDRMVP